MSRRTSRFAFMAPVLLLALACGDGGGTADAVGGSAAVAGTTASAGTSPIGGGGGGSAATSGGSPMNVPLAGSGQAIGGGDQGAFFGPGMAVEIMPIMMTGGSGGSGGSGPAGDGNTFTSTIKGSVSGTAVFTQRGEDVDLVVNLTNCADGNHQFRIHDGYSCDNASTEGMPWGARGTGIGPDSGIACSGGKGMLTYTRSGSDKSRNWTVGDHVQATDVTAHVVIVSDEKDPNSRAGCGNFF